MKVLEEWMNEVVQGDCLELLRAMPDDSVDMTFADPPFNLKKKYASYTDGLEFQEYLRWCDDWIAELVRVTNPGGAIFVHNIPKWLSFYTQMLNSRAVFKHWISWLAPTSPMGKSLQPAHYGILYYVKAGDKPKVAELRMPHDRERKSQFLRKDYGGKKAGLHPFGPLISDVWTDIHRVKHNKYRDEHPCQLPVALLERLLLLSTDEGDVVLDPFMGTGTTAVAAARLGRKFIGFELDASYQEIAMRNVSKVKGVTRLGDIPVSVHLKNIRTIRDLDWEILSDFWDFPPEPAHIDFAPLKLRREFLSAEWE